MNLKLKQIAPLIKALQSLDGLTERGEFKPFIFTSRVTWNKTKNLGILEREQEDIEKARVSKVTQAAGGKGRVVPEKELPAVQADWTEFLDTDREILGLLMLTPEDLNLHDKKDNPEGNRITSSVLAVLAPLIAFPTEPSTPSAK